MTLCATALSQRNDKSSAQYPRLGLRAGQPWGSAEGTTALGLQKLGGSKYS
jgi:hypothetical protein